MEIIQVSAPHEVPRNFTGRVDYYYNMVRFEEGIGPPDCQEYYLRGELHREDGPAAIFADGEKYWFLFGVKKTIEEVFELMDEEEQIEFLFNLDQWR